MNWQTLAEQEGERTELLEIPQRGCLVRVLIKQGDRWLPVTMTWCQGLQAADLSGFAPGQATPTREAPRPEPSASPASPNAAPLSGAAPAVDAGPSNDASPAVEAAPGTDAAPATNAAPATDAASAASEPSPERAATESATAAPEPPELVELLTSYIALQLAVCAGFRSKIGQPSGPIGFLADTPKVGSFAVKGHGDWIWRIEMSSVSLTNRRRVIELQIPSHFADNAFDPKAVASFLETTNTREFQHKNTRYPVDEATVAACTELLVKDGVLRLFAAQPRPIYSFVKK